MVPSYLLRVARDGGVLFLDPVRELRLQVLHQHRKDGDDPLRLVLVVPLVTEGCLRGLVFRDLELRPLPLQELHGALDIPHLLGNPTDTVTAYTIKIGAAASIFK